jgi:hypothetical protein
MSTRPIKVIVLRHAEKPIQVGNQRLAPTGAHRADYLSRWIPDNFGKPDYIFATEPTKSSFRPFLTIAPLWDVVKDSFLDVSVANEDARALGIHIRAGEDRLAGANIVVCWHHGKIPELLKGLGVKRAEIPDPWPENDFSTVFVVTYQHTEAEVSKYKMLF